MKKTICLLLAFCMVFALAACGKQAEPESKDWTRQGYFLDESQNILSVTWMDEVDEPGWYVGCMLGEDLVEDSWGGILPQEGSTLHGTLSSSGSKGDLTVTVSEEGEEGLALAVEGGETYHFKGGELPEASVVVNVSTEGLGYIAYAEGEEAPEIDPEYPAQYAYIGLAEPAVHTFIAWPHTGYLFVKWTKNGADFSAEPGRRHGLIAALAAGKGVIAYPRHRLACAREHVHAHGLVDIQAAEHADARFFIHRHAPPLEMRRHSAQCMNVSTSIQ